jgi:ribonuclease HII
MKTQFKKMHDSLKLSEEKHHLLKKKIYEEYRARIIDILCKKDKQSIAKIESTL